jgi:recombination protein RecR
VQYSSSLLEALIAEITRLPGLGRKSAQRIAFYLLRVPEEEATRLAKAIMELKARVQDCSICGNVTETQPCAFCADPRRDRTLLCVVEQAMDVLAIERTAEFHGSYHVLKGALSPVDGVGPEQIRIGELMDRIEAEGVRELIVATNPTAQGEATALYIARLLQATPSVKVTRIARGVPMGSDLEFSDQITLARAITGRKEI